MGVLRIFFADGDHSCLGNISVFILKMGHEQSPKRALFRNDYVLYSLLNSLVFHV
jgi:hypothetical protein